MTEEIKTQFRQEGEPAFLEEQGDGNSSDSSTDTTKADQTQSQGGESKPDENKDDSDFHKHPRWKEREGHWNERFNEQEKRHVEEINKLREEFGGKKTKENNDGVPPVPSWFGGDEDAWREYYKYDQDRITQAEERASQRAIENFTKSKDAEQKAIDEATKYFNDTVAEIESDKEINPNGEKIDRNKLLKFTMDYELVDTRGRWNYKAAYRLMKSGASATKPDLDEKKKIAGATTSENKAEDKKPNYSTSEDFRNAQNRPW